MNKYTKSILTYSVFLPLLVMGVPLIAILIGFGQFAQIREARIAAYNDHQERIQDIAKLEKEITPSLPEITAIRHTVSGDVQARLDKKLSAALRELDSDSIERTYRDFPREESPTGQIVGCPTQRITLRYLGRYEAMERVALKLEVDAPNLFLEDFRIERGMVSAAMGYESPHLGFNISYAAWKE